MNQLKLFKISQDYNNDWDTFDSAVVVATDEDSAKLIDPKISWGFLNEEVLPITEAKYISHWVNDPELVTAVFIADLPKESSYKEGDIVVASFNAG